MAVASILFRASKTRSTELCTISRGWWWLALLGISVHFACGDSERPAKVLPSAEEMRQFLGFGSARCLVYRYFEGSVPSAATLTPTGPDMVQVAGATVYKLQYGQASGQRETEFSLDFATPGEVRLLRWTDRRGGETTIKRYSAGEAPLFARLGYVSGSAGPLEYAEPTFETTSTPEVIVGAARMPGSAEIHKWVVQATDEATELPDGTAAAAIRLSYTAAGAVSTFQLVPGVGFVQFTNDEGRGHDLCVAEICEDGALSCAESERCQRTCGT